MRKLLIIFCFALVQLSCREDGGGIGPCVHIYKEPILHIEWARNSLSGEYLRSIVLSNIRIDSAKQDPFFLIIESRNVAALDSSLVCNPPCAFGVMPGTYSFTVSAAGVRDSVFSFNAEYTTNTGGCPSSSDGGTRVTLNLPLLKQVAEKRILEDFHAMAQPARHIESSMAGG